MRFILPSFLSFAICHSTPFCEIPTISASSFIVIYGVAALFPGSFSGRQR
jgi:hypothetical protein